MTTLVYSGKKRSVTWHILREGERITYCGLQVTAEWQRRPGEVTDSGCVKCIQRHGSPLNA